MQFSILFKFLKYKILTPTIKNKCRIYLAKDLKSYQRQCHNVIHHLSGANVPPVLKNIDYDNFITKLFINAIILIILILLVIYTFM